MTTKHDVITNKPSFLLTIGLLLASASPMAYADQLAAADQTAQATQAAATQSSGIEEIVVTARKRSENIQSVPLDITAVSKTALVDQDITKITDIARETPGFSVSDTGSRAYNKPFVRGITTGSVATYQAKVRTFLDGILVASNSQNAIPFTEVERVEILKGPQATAFGRGVIAGAISYVTADPTDYFSGTASAEIRSGDEEHYEAFLSGPIIPGLLKGYVSAVDYHYDGPLTNTYDGSRLGEENTKYIASKLVYTPNDWLTFKAYGNYDIDRDSLPAYRNEQLSLRTDISTPASLALTGGKPTIAPVGALTNNLFVGSTYDPREQLPYGGGIHRESYRAALTGIADLDFATLTVLSGYNQSHEVQSYASAYGLQAVDPQFAVQPTYPFPVGYQLNFPAGTFSRDTNFESLQQDTYKDGQLEARLASKGDGPLKWLVGANYFNYWQYETFPYFVSTYGAYKALFRTNSISGYGSVAYDFLDDFTITLEGRFNDDHEAKNYSYNIQQNFATDFYRFLPRATLDYRITPDISAYALYSEGSSPGFFNTGLVAPFTGYYQVKPEYLYNYEAGLKSQWFDRQFQANFAIYRADYKNQQLIQTVSALNPLYGQPGQVQYNASQIYVNAGASQTQGVEVALSGAPKMIPGLKINGTAAYTHAVFQSFCSPTQYLVTPFAPPAGFNQSNLAASSGYPGCVSVAGHFLAEQPEWAASISATYKRPISETWTLVTAADWSYTGRKFTDETNLSWTPNNQFVNIHAGVESDNLRIEAAVFNLTNNLDPQYAKAFSNGATFTAGGTNRFQSIEVNGPATKPRQFSIKVTYTFGGEEEPAKYVAPSVPMPAPAPAKAAAVDSVATPEAARSFQVFFDFDKSDITSAAMQVIQAAADAVKAGKMVTVTVTGHTDTVGSAAYNQVLSEKRADAVKAALIADGVSSGEITTTGVGKTGLLVPTGDGVREPQNRRAEIVLK